MIRSRTPIKSTKQLKEEQINFLLGDIEKNLQDHKKAIPLSDNQIAEAKKNTSGGKKKIGFGRKREPTT